MMSPRRLKSTRKNASSARSGSGPAFRGDVGRAPFETLNPGARRGVDDGAAPLSMEEVKPEDWTEKVYKPDIQGKWDKLYQKPGYDPF